MSASSHNATPFGLAAARVAGIALDRKTRAALTRGDSPRSGEPVWRNSYTIGQIEDRVWRPIRDGSKRTGKRWTKALYKAAKKFEHKTRAERQEKEPGARNGALGEVGLEVLEYLYDLVDYTTGRLEPAVRTIADSISRSYSAVHDALKRLRQHGFLHWMRRSKPVDDPQPGGPQVEQASNAYALLVPQSMKDWLEGLFRSSRIPQCEQDRRDREKDEFDRMLGSMSAAQRHEATWNGDSLLGETLKRLAAALDARDSQNCESGRSDETGGVHRTP